MSPTPPPKKTDVIMHGHARFFLKYFVHLQVTIFGFNMKMHHRRSIRLTGYDYTQNGCYFLTICTRDRECLFGEIQNAKMILSNIGEKVKICWKEIPNHFPQIILHEYVIMPNHIHGIVEIHNTDSQIIPSFPTSHPNGTSRTLGSVVRGFKIGVTKQVGFSPWQRNYYEHIIRNGVAYNHIVQYMAQNPMKWENDCFYDEF